MVRQVQATTDPATVDQIAEDLGPMSMPMMAIQDHHGTTGPAIQHFTQHLCPLPPCLRPLTGATSRPILFTLSHHTTTRSTMPPMVVAVSVSNLVTMTQLTKIASQVSHQVAWLTANYTSEAIILDHSSLLTYTYSASSNSIFISFKSSAAKSLAQQNWKNTSELLFVVHSSSCSEGGSCYLKATSVHFDQSSLSCTVSRSSIGFEAAISFFDFEWGVSRPGKKTPTTAGFSSTASAAGSLSIGGSGSSSSGSNATANDTLSDTTAAGNSSAGNSSTGGSNATANDTLSDTTAAGNSSAGNSSTGGSNATSNGTLSNDTAVGNYSAGGSNNDNCTAPSDLKYGLPTACLGQYFDEDLDDSYDYQDGDETDFSSFMAQFGDLFYPDPLAEDADDASEDNTDNTELGLTKRYSLLSKFITKFVAKVLPIQGVTTPYTKEISLMTMSMNVPKERTTVNSPWGQQVLIKSFSKTSTTNADNSAKLDIYCVDCGMQGTADITGKVGISVLEGISSLGANMKADMAMTLKVGIDAQLQYSQSFQQPLFNVPLSPLCVANVICV